MKDLPESIFPSDLVINGVISSDDVDWSCSSTGFIVGEILIEVVVRLKSGSDVIDRGASSIFKSCLCP